MDAILTELVYERGAPTLEPLPPGLPQHGVAWPGEEEIRRLYPVADAAFAG